MTTLLSKRLSRRLEQPLHRLALQLTTASLGLFPPILDGDLGLINSTSTNSDYGTAVVLADFNGDGIDDLVVGQPGETIDGMANAGRISASLGTVDGWGPGPGASLDSLGATNDPGARFGAALAVGHFNGDALPDLAIGIPGQRISGVAVAGGVVVLYGQAQGSFLDTANPVFFSQLVLSGNPELGDSFGAALAVGDFDHDGFDDLAVGSPFENSTASDAGVVNVIRGSATGLTTDNDALLSQESALISSTPGVDDFFGAALAAGDFDGDLIDDLAVGVPGETIGGSDEAGAVHIFSGSIDGIELADSQFWHGDVPDLGTTANGGDEMGFALAAGDFNGDDEGDLIISRPGRDRTLDEAGELIVIYGASNGTGLDGSTALRFGITTGTDADFDRFGEAIAIGDFDNDGYDDLAAAQPLANSGGQTNSGKVIVLLGGPVSFQIVFQILESSDFGAGVQSGAEFGSSLATGHFRNAGGGHGLVIGEPSRDSGSSDTGSVYWITSTSIFSSDFEFGLDRWSAVVGD